MEQEYRISDIMKLIDNSDAEVRELYKKSHKYKRIMNRLNAATIIATSITTASCTTTIGTALSGIGIVVSVPIGVLSAICAASGIVISSLGKYYERRLRNVSDHYIMASNHLCDVKKTVDTSLDDRNISSDEYNLICEKVNGYTTMRQSLIERKCKK